MMFAKHRCLILALMSLHNFSGTTAGYFSFSKQEVKTIGIKFPLKIFGFETGFFSFE